MKTSTTETSGSSKYFFNLVRKRLTIISKFKEAVALFRAKKIRPVPIKVFDISEITQAYRYFSGKNRTGKVVVSLLNQKSVIRVRISAACLR